MGVHVDGNTLPVKSIDSERMCKLPKIQGL